MSCAQTFTVDGMVGIKRSLSQLIGFAYALPYVARVKVTLRPSVLSTSL